MAADGYTWGRTALRVLRSASVPASSWRDGLVGRREQRSVLAAQAGRLSDGSRGVAAAGSYCAATICGTKAAHAAMERTEMILPR